METKPMIWTKYIFQQHLTSAIQAKMPRKNKNLRMRWREETENKATTIQIVAIRERIHNTP